MRRKTRRCLCISPHGITDYFSSGTPLYNYSIQAADVLGLLQRVSPVCVYFPARFTGRTYWSPFDTRLTSASILYAPEEYATDSSCTMRIKVYLGGNYVGTNKYQIPNPVTWPSGILSFSPTSPFDNIVINYDAPPPTGGDYGPIFVVDNLVVAPAGGTPTLTPTVTPTATPTPIPTITPSPTPTPTTTATPTSTPTSTMTPIPTPTSTPCTARCAPTPRPRPTPAPRP